MAAAGIFGTLDLNDLKNHRWAVECGGEAANLYFHTYGHSLSELIGSVGLVFDPKPNQPAREIL